MRIMTRPTTQKGFMAIVLVVFLVVFVAIAAAVVSMTTSGTRTAADHVQGSAALYLAESGIEWAARELFDADDPEAECVALEGQSGNINDGGTFLIVLPPEYNPDGNESCRVTSRGRAGPATRTIVGVIPKRVMDGQEGGGDDLFDDSDEKFTGCSSDPDSGQPVVCAEDSIRFNRPSQGPGAGQPPTQADGDELITDSFSAGDDVFFATNIDWDDSDIPTGNIFNIEITNNHADCDVALPDLTSACSAPPENPLYDDFDLVLFLGNDFSAEDVDRVRLAVNWSNLNDSNWVELTSGCIGRIGHCSGEGDDPTDDDGWDETG